MQVPATVTTFTAPELVEALRAAWASEIGTVPGSTQIAVLAAQVLLETGGGKSCVQWNIGNFKRPDPASGDFTVFLTQERVGTPPTTITVKQPFAAYASLDEGARSYLHSMWSHWHLAWVAVLGGNPEAFARGLGAQGYFTADPVVYAVGVRRWFTFVMGVLSGDPDATQPETDPPAFILPDPDPDPPQAA